MADGLLGASQPPVSQHQLRVATTELPTIVASACCPVPQWIWVEAMAAVKSVKSLSSLGYVRKLFFTTHLRLLKSNAPIYLGGLPQFNSRINFWQV